MRHGQPIIVNTPHDEIWLACHAKRTSSCDIISLLWHKGLMIRYCQAVMAKMSHNEIWSAYHGIGAS